MQQLETMLPVETNIKDAYANAGADGEQQFIQDLALFLCVYLKDHGALIEQVWPLKVFSLRLLFSCGANQCPLIEENMVSPINSQLGLGPIKGSFCDRCIP